MLFLYFYLFVAEYGPTMPAKLYITFFSSIGKKKRRELQIGGGGGVKDRK